LPIQIDEASSTAVADASGPADAGAEPPNTTPTTPESETPLEAADAEKGGSGAAKAERTESDAEEPAVEQSTEPESTDEQAAEPTAAPESAPEQAPLEPHRTGGPPEQPAPSEATSEAETAPEEDSTAEPAYAAGEGEAKKSFSTPAPATEMLDLEPETPILPPPAKVEEP
jgi:nicotinate-nucleotide--dimethylbenzimidazole phosphoribosyltransferase